jgi:hypothetical protein
MIPLTPALLLAAASALVDDDPTIPSHIFTPTSFIHHAGYCSHWDHRGDVSSWPLPRLEDCTALATFAAQRRVLTSTCSPGDIFVAWSPALDRFVTAGIVCTIRDVARPPLRSEGLTLRCLVIECAAAPEASIVRRRVRRLCTRAGDRFIHWPDLDAHVGDRARVAVTSRRAA